MSSYIPSLDCWLMVRDLPKGVKGFITRDENGTAYIIISSRLSEYEKMRTLMHESVHLIRGDLDSDEPRYILESDVIREF